MTKPMDNVVRFPDAASSPRKNPAVLQEEPAVVIILPVVWVKDGPQPPRKRKSHR